MNILMVLTSHDQLGDTGEKTGFWLEESPRPITRSRMAARSSPSPRPRAASRRWIPKATAKTPRPKTQNASKATKTRKKRSPIR